MAKKNSSSSYDSSYRSSSYNNSYSWWSEYKWWVIVPSIIVLVIIGVIVFFVDFMFDNGAVAWRDFIANVWKSWLFPNGGNIFAATPFFGFFVAAALVVLVLYLARNQKRYLFRVVAVVVIALVWGGYIVRSAWPIELAGAQYNLSTTTFLVHDENKLPSILKPEAASNESIVKIKQGELPTSWVSRVASATGALNVMKRTGDAINNTQLMSDTITYLYGDSDSTGVWTAIRNGTNQQPIFGVASWNGTGDKVKTCEFTGKYELNKAFGGMYGKNLYNSIAAKYSDFLYDDADMWGYCDGSQPIIVIPGTYTRGYDIRTVDEAAGVVVIKGSPSGEPSIELKTDVKAGDFPGPVYPQRLVDEQMGSLDWAAGRDQNYFHSFGFEVTDVSSQDGNNSDYLMKNQDDGRLYWVTPLKPRSTDSQTLIAYSITPADTVKSHVLNPQSVYVLNEDDTRVVNLDDLLARVTDAVRTSNPGFFTGKQPGKIVEFLPVSDTQWQVFAEVNGRVKYRIDVDVNARVTPKVVDIELGADVTNPTTPTTGNSGTPTGPSCDNPSQLTDAQLAQCLVQLSNELAQRQDAASKG